MGWARLPRQAAAQSHLTAACSECRSRRGRRWGCHSSRTSSCCRSVVEIDFGPLEALSPVGVGVGGEAIGVGGTAEELVGVCEEVRVGMEGRESWRRGELEVMGEEPAILASWLSFARRDSTLWSGDLSGPMQAVVVRITILIPDSGCKELRTLLRLLPTTPLRPRAPGRLGA